MKIIKVVASMLVIVSTVAHASELGVRARSFGGAIRAQASSNDVIFYNPAGLIKNRRISPDLDYLVDMADGAHRAGASIVDSKTGIWALGLAYNGRFMLQKDRPDAHVAYLSAALPIISDMFALGVSFHYTYDKAIGPAPYANYFNIDAGFLSHLPYGLSLAVVADHLLKPKGAEKALGLSLGTAFNLGEINPLIPLTFSFDWLMDDVKSDERLEHVLGLGFEYIVANLVPLRAGYNTEFKDSQKHVFSMGSGIVKGHFALDLLYQQNLLIGKYRHFGMAIRVGI